MGQTTVDDFKEPPIGTLKEIAVHPRVREFIEKVFNDYTPPNGNLLLIPESRQMPFTRSKLYARVQEFFRETSLNPEYHVVFVSHVLGACPAELAEKAPDYEVLGRWRLDEEVMARTSRLVAMYLERTRKIYRRRVAYARGSYFEVVRAASALSRVEVVSVLGERELEGLKRLSIRWAKVGLRTEEAFSLFRRRVVELAEGK